MIIVSITGSVAVGKSTFAAWLADCLRSFPSQPTVEVVSTDGFLYSAQMLHEKGLMSKKGFPESFHQEGLIDFLRQLKSGAAEVEVPLYSHDTYDLTGEFACLTNPDIVIIEGVNAEILTDKSLIDFSIFMDAPVEQLESQYLNRFKLLRMQASDKPESFFHKYSLMSEEEALTIAKQTWKTINEVNLNEHILPFKTRADWVLS